LANTSLKEVISKLKDTLGDSSAKGKPNKIQQQSATPSQASTTQNSKGDAELLSVLTAIDDKIVRLGDIITSGAPASPGQGGKPVSGNKEDEKSKKDVDKLQEFLKIPTKLLIGLGAILLPLISTIKEVVTNAFNFLKEAGTKIYDNIKTFFTETVPDFFKQNLPELVVNTATTIFNFVKESVFSAFQSIMEVGSRIVESVKEKITDLFSQVDKHKEDKNQKPAQAPPPAPPPKKQGECACPEPAAQTAQPQAAAQPGAATAAEGGQGEKKPAAIPEPTTKISGMEDVKAMIVRHEGKRNEPYKDSLGLWTVGVGHLIGDGKSLPAEYNRKFTDAEVMNLFEEDFAHHVKIAEKTPSYNKANEKGKAAFIDLAFNMGQWWPKWPSTKKKLEEGDFKGASEGLADSKWYTQVGKRAKEIVSLLAQGGPSQSGTSSNVSPMQTASTGTQVASATQAADIKPPKNQGAAQSAGSGKAPEGKPQAGSTTHANGDAPGVSENHYKQYYGVA